MGRREENKARKRQRLEDEGLRLFLEQGYDRCSIEQIAAASEVARGTFYLYFTDKLTLFETLIDRFFDPIVALLEDVQTRIQAAEERSDAFAIYQEMAGSLAMIGLQNGGILLLAFQELRRVGEAGQVLRKREVQLLDSITRTTRIASEKGLITAPDPRLYTLVIYGATERMIWEFLQGNDVGDDPEAVAQEVLNVFGRTLELPMAMKR